MSRPRGFDGNETWQLEALDPRKLAQIVLTAIDERIDREIFNAILADEQKARAAVLSRLGGG